MSWRTDEKDYFGNEIEQDDSYIVFDASLHYADIVKNDREELIRYLVDVETDLADEDTTFITKKELFSFIADVFDNDYEIMYKLGDELVTHKEYTNFLKEYDPEYSKTNRKELHHV